MEKSENNNYIITNIKTLLEKKNEDILNNLNELDDNVRDSLSYLEYCVIQSEKDEWLFEHDELFEEERNFLKQFTPEELSKFKEFSNFLIEMYSSENKSK